MANFARCGVGPVVVRAAEGHDSTMTSVAPVDALVPRHRPLRCGNPLTLTVSPATFRWLWCAVITAHVVSAGVLGVFAAVYYLLGMIDMIYYAMLLNPSPPNFQLFAIPVAMVALAHVHQAVGALVVTLSRRSLSFARPSWMLDLVRRRNHQACVPNDSPAGPRLPQLPAARDPTRLLRLVFGINSPYFPVFHVVREAIEVVVQILQASWASALVSSRFLNHVLVTVLALNCWSTSIALFLCKRLIKPSRRAPSPSPTASSRAMTDYQLRSRVIIWLVGGVLNAVSCLLVPMLLLVPYWQDFDFVALTLPMPLLYDDVYFAKFVAELSMIVTGTLSGLCLRLVPHVAILSCLVVVSQTVAARQVVFMNEDVSRQIALAKRGEPKPSTHRHPQPSQPQPRQEDRHRRKRSFQLVNTVFVLTGLGVVAVHLAALRFAAQFADDAFCSVIVAPWFATKFPCLVYTFDCAHMNQSSMVDGELAFLDDRALVTLSLVHCSALVVPSDIQHFHSLLSLNLKHLTLVDWPAHAGLRQEFHPVLVFVSLVFVNLTAIPAGLLGPLPAMLQDIEFAHTNLTTIPDDLHEQWPVVGTIYFEFSGIQEIPPSLLLIDCYELSLVGNAIENATVLELLRPTAGIVALDNNPSLTTLPDRIKASDTFLVELSAESTQIASIHPDLLAHVQHVYLHGTPFCGNDTAGAPATGAGSPPSTVLASDCKVSNYRASGRCLVV